VLGIFETESQFLFFFCPWLALNHNPPDLCLPSK
jgi:hypothetical protein